MTPEFENLIVYFQIHSIEKYTNSMSVPTANYIKPRKLQYPGKYVRSMI